MEKTIGKYKIEVLHDEHPFNPREDDNLGTMVCFPKHLGEPHEYEFNDYTSYEEMGADIARRENAGVILPLFILDHSGITINTTGYSCPWDSRQLGWIFISKEKMRYEYSYKRFSQKLKKRVAEYLKAEVETYAKYHEGDAWGYRITDTETEKEIEACWGYFGDEYCMEEAEACVKNIIAYEEKELQD